MRPNTSEHVRDILVIGAGLAGLYAVHAARQRGRDVLCLEAGSGVGGTWYWNRYPGARCDVESIDYSYSFDEQLQRDWCWSERYASQPEILSYIHHVTERFTLAPHIRLDTTVTSAVFDESGSVWRLGTAAGQWYAAKYLVCATGSLSEPHTPPIPGLGDFAGQTLYTAQWPAEPPSFDGKRVGVIGTGSSGIQSVPEIATQAVHLTVFQRTANYSVPAPNRPLTNEDQERIRREYPQRRQQSRRSGGGSPHVAYEKNGVDCTPEEITTELEKGWQTGGVLFSKAFPDQLSNPETNRYAREFAEAKIRAAVDDPETAEDLIPTDHPIGTKRICTDNGYYETFNRDNVTLVNLRKNPITTIHPWGVRTESTTHPLDVLVLATGFDALTGTLTRIDIRGRNGATLADTWSAGPVSYLGFQVPDFPNLFLVNGPGSPSVLANMILTSELQVDWILDLLDVADAQHAEHIETTGDAAHGWTQHVQEIAEQTLFPRANSWYVGANIAGKPRQFMLYVRGLGNYTDVCHNEAAQGYPGFIIDSH